MHKILSGKYYSILESAKYQKHKPDAAGAAVTAASVLVMPSVVPSTLQLVLVQLYLDSTTFHSTEHD